ncbi:SpoIIE family protein phosphatase [Streptomyces sp. NPDC002574]|uniref:SpoIIE family protein phosphatase n=1 Tax=Streptomyces sp. NPDC002574 TaxID=3364652 RepID=UPI0036AA41A4
MSHDAHDSAFGGRQEPRTAAEQLARTVARLRAELDEQQRTVPGRDAVERARGVLMERLGMTPREAREELQSRAGRAGRSLVQEAWALLGACPPALVAAESGDRTSGANPAGTVFSRARYTGAAAGSAALAMAGTSGELAQRLEEQLAGSAGVDALMVYVRSPVGGLDLVAHAGVGTGIASAWGHLPPIRELAPVEAVALGRPVWMSDLHKAAPGRPLVGDRPEQWPSRAWVPLCRGEDVVGVVGFLRRRPDAFDAADRALVRAAARACAAYAGPMAAPESAVEGAPTLQAVFDSLREAVVLLVPVRGPGGEVTDFRIEAAAPASVDVAGRTGRELAGLRVLESYPSLAGTSLWRGYLHTLTTGEPYESDGFDYRDRARGPGRTARYAVRVVRLGDALVVSWLRLDAADEEAERLRRLQYLGNLGWVDWDLATDTLQWSPQVYTLFDRDPALGPMPLDELPQHLFPEDLPATGAAVQALLAGGQPVDAPFRIRTPHGTRHLRFVAEAVIGARGRPVAVHGFYQDLTAQWHERIARDEAQRAFSTRQRSPNAEHAVARRLQNALLPVPERSFDLSGLNCDVSYLPAGTSLEIGGDWFTAVELPDGSDLLGVGDVAGHGIEAVATMAELRYGAEAMALGGTPPQRVLERLNRVLMSRGTATATMLLAHYRPDTGILTWARAGHLPILRLRDGHAVFLAQPDGRILGASHESAYGQSTAELHSGDRLFLFTDGLVERRGQDLDAGLRRLSRTAEAVVRTDCAAVALGLTAALGPADPSDDTCLLCVRITA